MLESSITGLFKTLLIIIGALVLLRFLGQLMNAKRNMEEERALNEQQRKANKERDQKMRNFGKTNVVEGKGGNRIVAEDVDFEEIE